MQYAFNSTGKAGFFAQVSNSSVFKAEAGVSPWLQGEPGLHNEFKVSGLHCKTLWRKQKLEKKNKTKQNINNKIPACTIMCSTINWSANITVLLFLTQITIIIMIIYIINKFSQK